MSIYDIRQRRYVTDCDKGETVKIVKGRKYPIGKEFVINGFFTDRWGKTYFFAKTGEKVNVDNVELVNPVEIKKKKKVFFVGNKNDACPHCKAEHSLHYRYDHFDPISDYVYQRYVCDKCTADVDTI